MTTSLLRSDYISALKDVLGTKIGTELTPAEAERMFFPFVDNGSVLQGRDNAYAYVLLDSGEKCTYRVIDTSDYNTILTLSFLGVDIGELTEIGYIVPVDNTTDGSISFKAENDSTPSAGFVSDGISMTLDTDRGSIKPPKFFGNKIYVSYSPNAESSEGRVIVYAKYKPHGFVFDVDMHNATDREYFSPCVGSGYRLKHFFLETISAFTGVFHLAKKAKTDLYNDTLVLQSSNTTYKTGGRKLLPFNGNANAGETHYGDLYFGAGGTLTSETYLPYYGQLVFEKIS